LHAVTVFKRGCAYTVNAVFLHLKHL
jgi:hypothetical protein